MFRFWRRKKQPSPLAAGKVLSREQQELFLSGNLVSGKVVHLLFSHHGDTCPADCRSSRIVELDVQGMLGLAQTVPPLRAINIGKPVAVTFLCREEDVPGRDMIRVGYETTLMDIAGTQNSPSDSRAGLLLVEPPQNLTVSNLRLAPRRDALKSELALSRAMDGAELTILDLSEGGARFALPAGECHREIGSSLDLNLRRGGAALCLKQAKVIRCQEGEAAVSFVGLDQGTRKKLSQIVEDLSRDTEEPAYTDQAPSAPK